MRTLSLVLLVSLIVGAPLSAQVLRYEVDLQDLSDRQVSVTLYPEKLARDRVTFQMPAWSPGAYAMTNYGRFVQDFRAFDRTGKELTSSKVDANRWEIKGAKRLAKITYEVRDSHRDSTSLWFALAHIDTGLFFANATALFGYVNDRKNVPAIVTYRKQWDWELSTALPFNTRHTRDCSFSQTIFKARNYDELVDAPVLAAPELQSKCFQEGSALYELAVASQKDFPMDSLEHYTRRIIRSQTSFFKETPFKHYTFLFYNPTFANLPSPGQGALEHANSSAYLLVNIPWQYFKSFGLRIISHEFFHLWNVKRIHSNVLGPFDYTRPVKTTSLWLSEGITDYYAHALLARDGIVPAASLLDDIKGWHTSTVQSRIAGMKSLEQLSLEESEFEIENATTFYTKGPLVGLMLDLEIRTRTNNKRSLDDVMLALNADAKKGRHFKDNELLRRIESVAGVDLKDFHRKYIAGTDTIPLESYLNLMGLTSKRTSLIAEDRLEVTFSPEGLVLKVVPEESVLHDAGLRSGDVITTVNGSPITFETASTVFGSDPDAEVKLEVLRNGEKQTIRFTPSTLEMRRAHGVDSSTRLAFDPLPDATPLQIAIREEIMGKLAN